MNNIEYLEWHDLNASRNYPFTDSSTLTFNGKFLPQSWIVDARIYIRGNYMETQACYISKLVRSEDRVSLQVSSYSGVLLGEAQISFNNNNNNETIALMDGVRVAGCLVFDLAKNGLIEAIEEGEYVFNASVASFLPSVCEYLPANQVQSMNDKSGHLTLSGNEGIRVDRLDSSTIKISIVGDPHFTRHNCVDGVNQDASAALNLNGMFLKSLTIVHYVKNSQGQLIGPVVSRLKQKADGSVVLALKTKDFDPALDTRELRPAFRITSQGNTLTFSMAGG